MVFLYCWKDKALRQFSEVRRDGVTKYLCDDCGRLYKEELDLTKTKPQNP